MIRSSACKRLTQRTNFRAPVSVFKGLQNLFSPPAKSFRMPEEQKWWDAQTVAVVTGANKGIGLETARILAQNGLKVVLTSRDVPRGQEALVEVQKAAQESGSEALLHPLDITDAASVATFKQWCEANVGTVTILINNAGFAFKGDAFGPDEAKLTIDTNFRGTQHLTEALLPLLASNARIVNVCSMAGQLRILKSQELRARFEQASTVEEVDELGTKFVEDIKAGRHAEEGWPNWMYGVSKLCEATYTRVLAQQLKPKGIMVHACCPGYCATDMSSWKGTKTAADGADTPVWLALQPPGSFETGRFWQERKEFGY